MENVKDISQAVKTPDDLRDEALGLESLLVSRAYLYTTFHKLFGGVPNEALLDELLGNVAASVVSEYAEDNSTFEGLAGFLTSLAADNREELLDRAKDEYMRLFVGPARLPALPWESPYRTNEPSTFQESTLQVRAAYQLRGLQPKRLLRVPDDHVSLLCAFMAERAQYALTLFRQGDGQALLAELRAQHAFVYAHLASWLPEYAVRARASKTAVLYPQMIEAAAAFSQVDSVFLGESSYWVEQFAGEGAPASPSELPLSELHAAEGSEAARAFAEVEEHVQALKDLRLVGIEEYELRAIA